MRNPLNSSLSKAPMSFRSPQAKHKTPLINGFDYTGVPEAIVKEAEATAIRIRDRVRAHTIDTGNELLNIKQKLEHGKFGKWLEFHFGWKERTAQNYMNSATAFGSTPQVMDLLPPSTVYKLAAKSTPDSLRQSVIEEINQGGTLDPKKIEKRIAEIKTASRENVDDSIPRDNASSATATSDTAGTRNQRPIETIVAAPMCQDSVASAEAQIDTQLHEVRATQIADLLKKRFGSHFDKLRHAILHTDISALRKALSEV